MSESEEPSKIVPPKEIPVEAVEYEPGLTWRSAMAIIFGGVAMLPVSIYISLVAGVQMAGPSTYIVAILFNELGVLLGQRFRKQEIFIIYAMIGSAMAGMAGVFNPFVQLVFRGYYLNYSGTWLFEDPVSGRPLPAVVPDWWAPRSGSSVYWTRSLLQPEWVFPVGILIVTSAFWALQEVSLTMITSYLYVEEERLPFPFAQISAQMVLTLTEAESSKMKIFTMGALGSSVYGLALYGIPLVTGGQAPIPIPWVDLTSGFYGLERFLPGAFFALATEPTSWVVGFLIPVHIAAYMVIGSVAIWIVGNHLALTTFASVFREWADEWKIGMSASLIWQRSTIRIWIVPQVMIVVAASIILIVKGRKYYAAAFKGLAKLSSASRKTGYLPLPVLIAMFLAGSSSSILLFYIFVPDFPIWMSIAISVGFSFVNAIVATRAIGETGFQLNMPYIWQGAILLSGYKGVKPWFISPTIGGYSAPAWTSSIKAAQLTNTRVGDWFRSYVIAFVVYNVMSLTYVSFLWALAPIPSEVYPYTNITWPINALTQSLWTSGRIWARSDLAIYFFVGMLGIGIIGELIGKYTPIPFSLIGLSTGTIMLPAYAIPFLVGSILGNYIIRARVGDEWWQRYRAILVASVLAGMGITISIAAALVMIMRATWVLPW